MITCGLVQLRLKKMSQPIKTFALSSGCGFQNVHFICCLRPYHVENTGSPPITEVKQHRARLVLEWVTAWEYRVLQTFVFYFLFSLFTF